MTRLLDDDLLTRFDAVLGRQPGELLREVGDPLSEGFIRAALAGLGVNPAVEIVKWLGRHEWSGARVMPGVAALGLESVTAGYLAMRGLGAESARNAEAHGVENELLLNPDVWWSPQWLLPFDLGGLYKLAVDCAGPADGPSPVRMIAWDGVGEPDYAAAVAPSLGEYVAAACDALEGGRYRYDPDEKQWLPMDWADKPIGEWFVLEGGG